MNQSILAAVPFSHHGTTEEVVGIIGNALKVSFEATPAFDADQLSVHEASAGGLDFLLIEFYEEPLGRSWVLQVSPTKNPAFPATVVDVSPYFKTILMAIDGIGEPERKTTEA